MSRVAWALAVVLTTGALPARADPTCSAPLVDEQGAACGPDATACNCPPGATVLMPAADYDLLIAGGIRVRHERDTVTAERDDARRDLSACRDRVQASDSPSGPSWGTVGTVGGVMLVIGILAGVLLAR